MPLAQNYIDDVSLMESGTSLTKTTMDTESDRQQRFHINMNNRGNNFVKNGITTPTTNNNNILADDDLPDIVSNTILPVHLLMKDIPLQRNACMDSLELPDVDKHHTFYLSSCESGTGIDNEGSNISSRHSSTSSSFSSSNVGISTTNSSIHTNIFFDILKRLYCSTLRRQKHGRYRTLSSSLHLFFKKPYQTSENQFFKSPSYSQLPRTSNQYFLSKKSRSHQQLNLIDTNKDTHFHLKTRRSLLRHRRASDKTVSEDNNTNTMSSLDLTTIPPTVFITDSNSSATFIQRVSDFFL